MVRSIVRSILALGKSLLQAIVILAESLWYEFTAFTLVLVLCFLTPTWFASGIPGVVLLFGILFASLTLVNVRLFRVQVKLGAAQWSYRQSLLRFILECIAGCFVAGISVVVHTAIAELFGITSFVSTNYESSAQIASVLALGIVVGIPGYRFWRVTHRFHLLRVTEKILDRLDARYQEHLRLLLSVPDRTFPVEVAFAPLDFSPDNPSSPDQPTMLERPVQSEAIPFPALSASLRQPPPDQPLTFAEITNAQICQHFDESQRQMFIFSEAGGGKSAQLYLLANTLLVEARAQLCYLFKSAAKGGRRRKLSQMPMLPIILDLSVLDRNFGVTPHAADPVRDWQVVALVKIYGVRHRTARRWVAKGRITSLCDSLDDLNDPNAHFISMNTYLQRQQEQDHTASIVVCCREQTYQRYQSFMSQFMSENIRSMDNSQPGSLGDLWFTLSAVTLQSLSPTAVERELRNAGNASAIRSAIQHDSALIETLRSPMMLRLALSSMPASDFAVSPDTPGGEIDWPMRIVSRYISGLLNSASFPRAQAEVTLAWLGYQLREREKLVFHLEELQHDWLPSPASKSHYDVQIDRVRRSFITVTTLLFGIILPSAIAGALIMDNGVAIKAIIGSNLGISMNLIWPLYMMVGLLGGFGLASSIGHRINGSRTIELLKHLHPIADVHWRKLVSVTQVGIFALLAAAFIGGPLIGLSDTLLIGAGAGVATGLLIAWCGRLATERNHFPPPNRGLSNAIASSLVILLIMGLLGGCATLAVALFMILIVNLDVPHTLPIVLVGAVVVALIVAIIGLGTVLINGGGSVLRHRMLRRALGTSRIVPQDFVRFLDDVRATGLLRREGDGYSFLARSTVLRDYFAEDYKAHHLAGQQILLPPLSPYERLGKRIKRASQLLAPRRIAQSLWPRRQQVPR